MTYTVRFTFQARKTIDKLDRQVAFIIMGWIQKNLVDCEDPRAKGKGLVGDHSGEWRYRVGDYRIIVDIRDTELIILFIAVGHRNNIY